MNLFSIALPLKRHSGSTAALVGLILAVINFSTPAEIILGPQLAAPSPILPGDLLLRELNCVACHAPSAETRQRLPARPAPNLGDSGQRITPQYLRKWLANPHDVKPGTPMPDLLHSLPAPEKESQVEALTHFLVSLQPKDPSPAVSGEDYHLKNGESLYHSVGCVACHAPSIAAADSTDNSALANLSKASVPLGDLARKTTLTELTRFLLDPLKSRPSGRMPSLALNQQDATSIATYLLRGQLGNTGAVQRVQGVRFQYFDKHASATRDLDKLTPAASGTTAMFSTVARKKENNFGFRFTGSILIPRDGEYTFHSHSDDGSRIFINDKLVVDNDGEHAPAEKSGKITLTTGHHPILVSFTQGGGGHELKISWEGPGLAKQEIPTESLSHIGTVMTPLDSVDFTLNPDLAKKGSAAFASLGCASCHQVSGHKFEAPARKDLASLNPANGCLSESPAPGLPKFSFSPAQRGTLRATLQNKAALSQSLSSPDQINLTLASLNCLACHTRDGTGGPTDQRLAYFKVNGEADLGDEGRIPPHLTKVGGKLRPEWTREVLLNKGYVRPYMATRMPQFGEPNVGHLPALFDKIDSPQNAKSEPTPSPRDAKFGRRLAGVGGLTCISCHTFGTYKSLGIPAVDLASMHKRLKYDWVHRYLIDPASLRPGTRMPTFWPEGKATNPDILKGNTDDQISALWSYLAAGREAEPPAGLVQGRMEIVAETEPAIYRHFIQGAGTRAIGVGYPEKLNLAWDGNEMRPALIWQGPFIDAARHSSGRGEGFEPPLGNNVVNLPSGPMFARLDNPDAPWPTATGRKAGMHLGGYQFSKERRPAFSYTFEDITVEDFFEPAPGEIDPIFQRRLTLNSKKPLANLWFRAAVGDSIQAQPDQSFLVNKKITMRFPGSQPRLRKNGGRDELLIPVTPNGQSATIQQEIIW